MRLYLLILALAAAAFAQTQPPPSISVGPNAPSPGLCSQLTVGNLYVRSQDPANGPIQAMRCTQTAALQYAWMSIDHFVGPNLPTRCATGDVAFKTGVTAGLNLYGCTSTDTWTAQAGGTGGASIPVTTSILAGDGAGNAAVGTATGVAALFTGCTGTKVLAADGTCKSVVGTATNIDGGSAGQIPYQTGAGATAFSSGLAYTTSGNGVLGLIGGYTAGQTGTATGTYAINGSTSGTVTITGANAAGTWSLTLPTSGGTNGQCLVTNGSGVTSWGTCGSGSGGTVTTVGFTGGLISIANPTTTPALTVAGTSGGVPYFASSSTWASSGALTANLPVIGGGAGSAPGVGTRSGNTTAFVTTTGTQTSGRCVEIDASGNHIASAAGCAAGAGTVSVVGSGALTSTALVTGGGTTTLQTAATTATMDSSGNISTPGSVSTGVGGSVGGHVGMGAGTATVAGTGIVGFQAPSAVTTPFYMNLPAAPTTGFLLNSGTTDPSTISFVTSSGIGSVCLTTSCAMTTPNLGTPSAINLTNATSPPTWNQNTTGTAANLSGTPALPNGVTATTQSAADNTTKLATTAYADAAAAARSKVLTLPFGCAVGDPAGSALSTGVLCYITVPTAGTIVGWDIEVDAGTATVDVLKVATGTAIPTASIAASALPAISTGTAKHSTTLTSWTTSVAANDILGFSLTAVSTAKYITVNVQVQF